MGFARGRFLAVLAASAAFALAAVSCSRAYSDEPGGGDFDAAPFDGPTDGPPSEGAVDAASDAKDADAGSRACTSKGTTKDVSTLTRGTIYAPSFSPYPFGIATDLTHVYWVEQTTDTDAGAASEGLGVGRILRATKSAGPIQQLVTDQSQVTSLAVEGGFVYWGAGVATTWQLLRIPSNPSGPAVPEAVATFGGRIVDVRVAAAGVLLVLLVDGRTYRVDPSTRDAALILTAGASSSIAATLTHVYASSETIGPAVRRVTLSPPFVYEANYLVPNVGGGNVGVGKLATDCTSLWMTHDSFTSDTIYVHDFLVPGTFERRFDGLQTVEQIVADDKNVWVAAQTSGVVVGSRKGGAFLVVYNGAVGRIAVDDDGVYFADRASLTRGRIYMLVK
ncbi:MAG: hypothetical protein JST00_45020 [Deltaproteobacteria bacterium]|nr:hypothetical protein [Deltaproteobacteria bacterium]